jgi:hypothetical protein
MTTTTIELLEKHVKYTDMYKPNTLYWGLGIENELYLEFEKKINITQEMFLNNHKRERYSVDYYTGYKKHVMERAFFYIAKKMKTFDLPVLMNSHSLSKTDSANNPQTLYTKLAQPNPKFNGITLSKLLFTSSKYLQENYNKNFVYEGDIIEFITLDFFNTTLEKTINELITIKNKFIETIQEIMIKNNIFNEYGSINFIKDNHPFGILLTNMNNISIFNNGTLHFNITLPTFLDDKNNIIDMNQFTKQHAIYIKLIQYMEPILLCIYGSPDPFSYIKNKTDDPFLENIMFSSCSQRCAVSRYISIGTYDTDIMKPGKLLTDPITLFKVATEPYGWYKKYHDYSAYNKLSEIGYDINFHKHHNHGIEVRFFDHISDIKKLEEAFQFIIYLGDYALSIDALDNPIISPTWNNLVIDSMKYGLDLHLNNNYLYLFSKCFNHKFIDKTVNSLYYNIFNLLKERSRKNNSFSKYVLKKPNVIYTDV